MRLYPVNTAETMLCVFFDTPLSDFKEWTVAAGKAEQSWPNCRLVWDRKFSMTRRMKVDIARFDQLLVSISLNPGASVIIDAETDKGRLSSKSVVPNDNGKTNEFLLPLQGATQLQQLTLTIDTKQGDSAYLKFILLADSTRLKDLMAMYDSLSNLDMSPYLLPQEGFTPGFTPKYGIFCNATELERIRKQMQEHPKYKNFVARRLAEFKKTAPNAGRVGEYNGRGRRFVRDRDLRCPRFDGLLAAWYGMMLKEPNLMHLAARRAIALALTPHWNAGVMANVHGSTFEHRAFDECAVMEELALILDFCHEAFTPYGRELVHKALSEKGISVANFNAWRWDYIYGCNQLGSFSRARILTGLILERNWRHFRPYTDLSLQELNESMGNILAKDGGYGEGAAYYQYTFHGALFAYYFYAKARKLPLKEVLPPALNQTEKYVELIMSTDDRQGFLPINDGGSGIYPHVALILARLFPNGPCRVLYEKHLKQKGLPSPDDIWSQLLGTSVQAARSYEYTPFIKIDSIRSFSSVRNVLGKRLKIFATGHAATCGHVQPDAGQVILEYDGETFLMDSGTYEYSSPNQLLVQREDRHNVMVPVAADGKDARQNYVKQPIPWTAAGDEKGFQVEMDLTTCWKGKFSKRIRRFQSQIQSPLALEPVLLLKDSWKLAPGYKGVKCYFLSPFPFKLDGNRVSLTGNKGNALHFSIPKGWNFKTEKLTLAKHPVQYRLTLASSLQQGDLELAFSVAAP